MISVVVLGAVTEGINLATGASGVGELEFVGAVIRPSLGSGWRLFGRALEGRWGGLPVPNSGGLLRTRPFPHPISA
jgi:hypothetical protein